MGRGHGRPIFPLPSPGGLRHPRLPGAAGIAGRMTGTMRLRTKLAWAWLALLFAAALLGKLAGIGPLGWFETWFAVWTGRLLSADILFALLILALPSLWILFGAVDRAGKARRPSALRKDFRLAAIVVLALAVGFLIMAAYAGLRMASLPGGDAASVKPTGSLAEAAAAGQRVMLTGVPIEGARAAFIQPSRQSSSRWVYTGFRPGATRGAPVAAGEARAPIPLFVEQRENDVRSPYRYVPPPLDEVQGYLVENGLPDHARIVMEREGVTIATPHYLLKVDENGLRGPHYVPLFTGLFFAFVFGLIGVALLVKAGVLGRRGGVV